MNNRQHPLALIGQGGAATLLVVLLLLLGMTIIVVTASRTGMVEQQITGNDIRAREAQEAAEAGLEYAISWANQNPVDATMNCPGDAGCPSLTNVPDMTPDAGGKLPTSSGETYTITALVFTKGTRYIKVESTAQGVNDNSITAKSEAYIEARTVLSDDGSFPPPLAINGCMTNTGGTPDIYPNWNDLDNDGTQDPNEWTDGNGNGTVDIGEWIDSNGNGTVDNELGDAILTSRGEFITPPNPPFCLDYCGSGPPTCDAKRLAEGTGGHSHLDLHNGVLEHNVAFPNNSIWDYYFKISQAQFKTIAETTLSTDGGLYWITSTSNWSNGTYGSASDPVIIVFENGCPKPSGNTTVYGILFYLDPNGCSAKNAMVGWGHVAIYGSIGVNSGVDHITANVEIHGVGDGTGMPNVKSPVLDATRIPGTWKDF